MEQEEPIKQIDETLEKQLEEQFDNTPVEPTEEDLEEIDEDLVCSICLDLLYNPLCTQCGHTFCKSCLAESLLNKRECPLCNELCYISNASVNVTLRKMLEKMYPKYTKKREFDNELKKKRILEEMKQKDSITDIPVFFIMGHVTPGSFDYFRIFEQRYHDMINLVMPGDRKFVIIRKRAEKLGYVVKVQEYRRVAGNRTIIKVQSLSRIKVDDYYIPENREGLYNDGQEQLWFTKGNIIKDEFPQFEEDKENTEYIQDLKLKANKVKKLIFDTIELRKSKISRRNMGWVQIRYKFAAEVSWSSTEEFITQVGLTALNYFYYGGGSNNEKVDLLFNGTPKERLEFSLKKLEETDYRDRLFWFEDTVEVKKKKSLQGFVLLIVFFVALFIYKYIDVIQSYLYLA